MTCRQLIEFLDDYVEGRITVEERGRFDAHLMGCRACVEYLAAYRQTIALAKNASAEVAEMPDGLVRAIMAARGLRR